MAGLLDDPTGYLSGLLGAGWDRFRGVDPATGESDYWKRGGVAGLLGMPSWDEQPKTDIAMGFAGATTPAVKGLIGALPAPTKGIRAYHGSPHDFDKFDLSKIGTGEGAQAYGHGLYFAENEGVARGYRDVLAKPTEEMPRWRYRGEPVLLGNDHYQLASALENAAAKPGEAAGDVLKRRIAELDDQAEFARKVYGDDTAGMYRRKADALRAIDPESLTLHSPGRMYEVQINADPERFLDWDKPLSGQPAGKQLLQKADLQDIIGQREWTGSDFEPPSGDWIVQPSLSGESAYRRLADEAAGNFQPLLPHQDYAGATKMLRDAGIPGIKYLDQGSRAAGEGSRNYVVFDDSLISILRKYGLLGPMAGGATAGAVGDY